MAPIRSSLSPKQPLPRPFLWRPLWRRPGGSCSSRAQPARGRPSARVSLASRGPDPPPPPPPPPLLLRSLSRSLSRSAAASGGAAAEPREACGEGGGQSTAAPRCPPPGVRPPPPHSRLCARDSPLPARQGWGPSTGTVPVTAPPQKKCRWCCAPQLSCCHCTALPR